MRRPIAGEVLLSGGRVYAGAADAPVEAILIRDGRVVALGGEDEVGRRAGPGKLAVRLQGATVTPGFTDAHIHLTSWALGRRRVSLTGATTIEAAAAAVAEAARSGEGWILGQGWSRHDFERLPTRADLDRVVAARPVLLDSRDLHSAWLNTEGLRSVGIDATTADPPGGRIERKPGTGEPTGVVFEAARAMVVDRLPKPTETEIRQALIDAQIELHAMGITGIHSVEATGLSDLQRLDERGELTLRVLQHIQLNQLDAAIRVGIRSGFGDGRIRIGGVKIFLDGSLGSRTAWLRRPYEGDEADRGIQTIGTEEFREAVRIAGMNGIAATVHAIGDAAVELALDVLESTAPPSTLPHRIEHLQLCPPDLWRRAGRSGIIGSMQPVHLLGDIVAADRHWGADRSRGAYAFGALAREGMVLAFGSDAPVETPDPRPGLFAARRRVMWTGYGLESSGAAAWYPEHELTGPQAVSAYTEGPALAAGLAASSGRLRPGYDADLTVWSADPVTARPHHYPTMECLMTMVGGEIVWRRGP